MVSLQPPVCEFGKPIVDFSLKGVDNRNWSMKECMGEKGLLVMFICNHCPYVKAVIDRLVRDTQELKKLGINSVGINSNDPNHDKEDSFENMVNLASKMQFSFPYLVDDSQSVAKAYGAVCTPDFFGFNASGELQYRGRLDESRKSAADPDVRRDLFEGMKEVSLTQKGPNEQFASMGCSIKWKEA
tara:strand:+ start:494 stop:1051 length:558 start_codon:yes stop_codon:yes gene_type:complete